MDGKNGEKIEQANVHLNLLPYGIPVAAAAAAPLRDPLKIIVVALYIVQCAYYYCVLRLSPVAGYTRVPGSMSPARTRVTRSGYPGHKNTYLLRQILNFF